MSDFVRRLECMFRTAYGREPTSAETKDMLLYGQLQDGLHLQLMRAPAVSGAKNYQELIVVAKNEERRLADLRRVCSLEFPVLSILIIEAKEF